MNIIYVIWCGDTPDKGVATDDVAVFGKAREAMRRSGIDFRWALVPVSPPEAIPDLINQLIEENK